MKGKEVVDSSTGVGSFASIIGIQLNSLACFVIDYASWLIDSGT